MSDEIEIEEHDLLDDPTVRNIFPDIARLKQEILDYEYDEERQQSKSTTSNFHIDNIEGVVDNSNDSVNNSEINLIPQGDLQDTFQDNNQHDGFIRGDKGIEVHVLNNKIILGTKPAGPVETKSEHFEKNVKPYCAVVVLEDFGLYLQNSSRYCKQCLIFFPTNSDYNSHRQIHIESKYDSENLPEEYTAECQNDNQTKKLKAVVERKNENIVVQKKTDNNLVRIENNNENICLKCNKVFTRRNNLKTHMIAVHKVSKKNLDKIMPGRELSKVNECFHCKKIFHTQNLLIEHIYSILQTPNNRSDKFANKMVIGNKTNKDFTLNKANKLGNEIKNLEEFNKKNKGKFIQKNRSTVEKIQNVSYEAQNVIKVFKCQFCLTYFNTIKVFFRHMSIKHKTVKNLQATKVVFNPQCEHCPKICDSVVQYNRHLYKSHRQTLVTAIQESRRTLLKSVKGNNLAYLESVQNYIRCDICFLYFKDMSYYNKHMSSKHKSVKIPNAKFSTFDPKCPYCPKTCHNLKSFNKHMVLTHPDKLNNAVETSRKVTVASSERESSTASDDDIDMNTECYTCNYCLLYFKSTKMYIRHMTIKHKMIKIPKSKKVKFNPKCKFCPKTYNSVRLYNQHIHKSHSLISNRVIKIQTQKNKNKTIKIENRNNIKNQKGIECYRCTFCPSYFMTMTYYVQHMKVRHKTLKVPKPKKAIFDPKCKYCPAILNDIKIHNKHLYNNHYVELNEVIEKAKKAYLVGTNDHNKTHTEVKKVDLTKTFYRCCYCSYYFKTLKFHNKHVMKKHKVQQVHEVKKIVFDPKCKYCSTVASNDIAYNKHLGGRHRNRIHEVFKESSKNKISAKKYGFTKEKDSATVSSAIQHTQESKNLKSSQSGSKSMNTEKNTSQSKVSNVIVPISKSALFKCLKCDIHFLTIKSALDHLNHMEMLINWKCALCHRIFKDNDRWLHQKQHLFSHVFTVYDIDQSNISQILYKCSKCAMHFDESVVDSHHYECALKISQSYMCKICDILVDNKAQICHEYNHKHRSFTSNDFIIIETTAVHEETEKNKLNVKDKIGTKNTSESSSHSNILNKNLKRKITNDDNIERLKFKKIKKDHIAGSSLNKLKINNDSINYSSEVSIMQQRYDKFSLKLSFCNTCNCFVSMIGQKRKVHAQKRCAHMKSVICKDCGLRLSNKTINTHRQMHLRIKNLQLHHFKFYDFKSGKRVHPPMPQYEKCVICDVHFISKSTLGSHVCSDNEYKVCNICKIKLFKPNFHLHMAFHKYGSIETSTCGPSDNTVASNKVIKVIKNNKNILWILYCCKVCYVFVDTYDHLIEHCQKHCLNDLSQLTEECKICNLPFLQHCMRRHAKIHETVGVSAFEKLFFDPFYFRFDHTVWLKHLFGSHSHIKKEDILLNSVYRHEHRFKMEIIQEGLPDLTLYKCVKCDRHVEPDIIYLHIKNSCSNLRKYRCHICQLDFISSFSLQRHKATHENSKPRRYRIIHFNKQEDAELTKVIFSPPKLYVLYQCRHCNVVVGSTQRSSHQCNTKTFTSCSDCGLMINDDIYELHSSMHKTLDSFISENMKVILFGQYQSHSDKYVAVESSFRGQIHDYSFYRCSECDVCIKHKNLTLNHSCCWKGQPRVACSICGLYFYADKLISHIKNHETDPDFVLDNMIFIEFHPSVPKANDDELQNKTSSKGSSTNNSIDFDTNRELKNFTETAVLSEVLKDDSLRPENAKDTTIREESIKNTAVCLENAKNSVVSLESVKDIAVYPENANETEIELKSVKDTVVSLENTKDTVVTLENSNDTTVTLENVKHTSVSLQIANDTIENVENPEDAAVGIESAKDTAVRPNNSKDTPVGFENIKDTAVSLENTKDTSVNLKNGHNSIVRQENAQDTVLNQQQENNLPAEKEIDESEKTAYIYRCKCGLHFLDEKSMSEHFSQCGSKSKQAKQNCSKCGLLFTPNVLFKHLLTHHGDKNLKFQINIFEKGDKTIIYLQK